MTMLLFGNWFEKGSQWFDAEFCRWLTVNYYYHSEEEVNQFIDAIEKEVKREINLYAKSIFPDKVGY